MSLFDFLKVGVSGMYSESSKKMLNLNVKYLILAANINIVYFIIWYRLGLTFDFIMILTRHSSIVV